MKSSLQRGKALLSGVALIFLAVVALGCNGRAEPTPTKTPRPTDTVTPLPTVEIALPAVESGQSPSQPIATLPAPGAEVSPLQTPTATPLPGFDAQPPVPVLAANLSCGAGCDAGNPDAVGLAILDQRTGQFLIWTEGLAPLTGEEYEGWLTGGGAMESSGRFNAEEADVTSSFGVLSPDVAQRVWESFVITIEPEPDDSDAPAALRSIGGPLRSTVMGEALYSRFNMPCQQCHGPQGEGGSAAALAGTALSFAEFEAAVRTRHPDADFSEGVIATRDLQHIYAWLRAR